MEISLLNTPHAAPYAIQQILHIITGPAEKVFVPFDLRQPGTLGNKKCCVVVRIYIAFTEKEEERIDDDLRRRKN
jgi:hypothetical protein